MGEEERDGINIVRAWEWFQSEGRNKTGLKPGRISCELGFGHVLVTLRSKDRKYPLLSRPREKKLDKIFTGEVREQG